MGDQLSKANEHPSVCLGRTLTSHGQYLCPIGSLAKHRYQMSEDLMKVSANMQMSVGRMFEAKGKTVVKAQVRCVPDLLRKIWEPV